MSIVRTTFFTFFFTMASRKQVEEMLLLSFIHGFISEEEFGVLHEALQTKNPIFVFVSSITTQQFNKYITDQ